MDHLDRIARLESEVRQLRMFGALGVVVALGASGLAAYIALRSPSTVRAGRVAIDDDSIQITGDRGVAKLTVDGLMVKDAKASTWVHASELGMAGANHDHKVELWIDDDSKIMFSLVAAKEDVGFSTEIGDGIVSTWKAGPHAVTIASTPDAVTVHGHVIEPPPPIPTTPSPTPTSKSASPMPF